jgi:TetR/AcrR family transcriptional regulator
MENKKLSRRERKKLQQRQEILVSALDLFSQKGYHSVSMHEIADRAEFAIGTLYRFFRNKEDLYEALLLDQCEKFDETITRAIEDPGDEIEKLQKYILIKSQMIHEKHPVVRLFLAERWGVSFNLQKGRDDELHKRYQAFLEKLAEIFESGIKNKRFRKIADPFHLAVALDNFIDTFLLFCSDAPASYSWLGHWDAILEILFGGMMDH